jgi:hypothetical protein
MNHKIVRAAWALTFVTAWSGVAHATDDSAKADARNLAKAAKRDFDAGHFEDAQVKFQRAYAIAKVPTLALWTARVLVKRGQFIAGADLYRQATQLAPNDLWIGKAQEQAQADAKRELAGLELRIPKLRIHVQGAMPNEVQLTVDDLKITGAILGSDLPAVLPVDPGQHRVVGKTRAQTLELAIDLAEGESKDAFLKFNEGASVAAPVASDGTSGPAAKNLLAPTLSGVGSAADLTTHPLSSEPAAGGQPVYAKWWFWTGIGAVAIAGTVTAFVLTRHPGGACGGANVPCVEVR